MELIGTQTIETERLLLRKYTLNDAEDMYNNWAKYEDCFKYLPWEPCVSTHEAEERIKKWIELYKENTFYQWGIELIENKEIIGFINLHNIDEDNYSAETTYILSPKFWNKGIMTEAVNAVLKFGFECLGLNRISAEFYSGNDNSQKVMLKINMTYEGTLRERYFKSGSFYDSIQYSVFKKDWEQKL
ncbi:MAG: ribosomal-protein-alanine acetyltransferase [Sedimentibacter sp.]|jgi:ribosomal-protein-alanine N-acetyltransferase|nr:ribosomal-protein-alanine acetyltransferase [Sedimentibacter sp.]